jgi:formylglycine-generating enzyme required for sulfatase activity
MTGNVMEWTWDAYDVPPLGGADPLGRAEGTLRVVRGGSWNEGPVGSRLVRRLAMGSDRGNEMTGFRLARTVLTETTQAAADE